MIKSYDVDGSLSNEDRYKKIINYLSYEKDKGSMFFGMLLKKAINDAKKYGIIVPREKVISDIEKKEKKQDFYLNEEVEKKRSSVNGNSNEMLIQQLKQVKGNINTLFNLDENDKVIVSESNSELSNEKEELINKIISVMDNNELQVVPLQDLKDYFSYMSLDELNDVLDRYLNKDKLVVRKLKKY